MLRTVGRYMGKIKRMSAEFQGQFQEALREAEMTDLSKHVDDLKSTVSEFTNFEPLADKPASSREPCRTRRRKPSPPRRRSTRLPPRRPRPSCRRRPCRQSTCRCPSRCRPSPMPTSRRPRRRPSRLRPRRRLPRRRSGPGTPHDARGHRGHQGPADGAPDRAAVAADQGAARLRRDVRALLHLRQGHLQRPGLALRLCGGAGELQVHLHGAARIFRHAVEARHVRRRVPVVPDHRRRSSICSSRPASTGTSARPSCRI